MLTEEATEEARSLQQDLKVAAKDAAYKRNRSPDDGFQLVGDRRKHVNQPTPNDDESSPEEDELSISQMVDAAKKNAAELHDQMKEREKLEKKKEKERAEREERKAEKERKKEKKERKEKKEKGKYLEEQQDTPQVDATELLF